MFLPYFTHVSAFNDIMIITDSDSLEPLHSNLTHLHFDWLTTMGCLPDKVPLASRNMSNCIWMDEITTFDSIVHRIRMMILILVYTFQMPLNVIVLFPLWRCIYVWYYYHRLLSQNVYVFCICAKDVSISVLEDYDFTPYMIPMPKTHHCHWYLKTDFWKRHKIH